MTTNRERGKRTPVRRVGAVADKDASPPSGKPPTGPPSPAHEGQVPKSQNVLQAQVQMYQAFALAANKVVELIDFVIEQEQDR